jgi:hypothetical protein
MSDSLYTVMPNCNIKRVILEKRYWILSWTVTLKISARRRRDKTSTNLHANKRERDNTNLTNGDVLRSVCSDYLRQIFVVRADMTHSP